MSTAKAPAAPSDRICEKCKFVFDQNIQLWWMFKPLKSYQLCRIESRTSYIVYSH